MNSCVLTLEIAMKKNILLVCTCFLLCHFAKAQSESISLAGTWTLKLDSMNVGLQQKWYDQSFSQQITLPGTLDDAGIGATPSLSTDSLYKAVLMSLTRKHRYVGVAWYKKEIEVPESFAGRDLQLSLERVIWKTTLWIDGEEMGSNESLSAAQLFNIRGGLKAGKHAVVLRIDNNKQHEISVQNFAHAYTDGTQIMWNGVIGKLELKSIPAISIKSVQIYPDIANKQARVALQIHNSRGKATSASVLYSLFYKGKEVANIKSSNAINPGNNIVTATIAIDDVKLWDEFTPNLYSLKTAIQVDQNITDDRTVAFGMREWLYFLIYGH
jgi:beta-galactosidase/beta-glucuronidase